MFHQLGLQGTNYNTAVSVFFIVSCKFVNWSVITDDDGLIRAGLRARRNSFQPPAHPCETLGSDCTDLHTLGYLRCIDGVG